MNKRHCFTSLRRAAAQGRYALNAELLKVVSLNHRKHRVEQFHLEEKARLKRQAVLYRVKVPLVFFAVVVNASRDFIGLGVPCDLISCRLKEFRRERQKKTCLSAGLRVVLRGFSSIQKNM